MPGKHSTHSATSAFTNWILTASTWCHSKRAKHLGGPGYNSQHQDSDQDDASNSQAVEAHAFNPSTQEEEEEGGSEFEASLVHGVRASGQPGLHPLSKNTRKENEQHQS